MILLLFVANVGATVHLRTLLLKHWGLDGRATEDGRPYGWHHCRGDRPLPVRQAGRSPVCAFRHFYNSLFLSCLSIVNPKSQNLLKSSSYILFEIC